MKNKIEFEGIVLDLDQIIGFNPVEIDERFEDEIQKHMVFRIYFKNYSTDIEYGLVSRYRDSEFKFDECSKEIISKFRKISSLLRELIIGEIDIIKFNSKLADVK